MDTNRTPIQFAYRNGSRPTLLAKRRAWFVDEAAADTTDSATDTTATDTAKGKAEEKGLTQEKVNELIGKARGEGKSQALTDLLKELGLEKVDDLKKVVTDKKQAEEAQLTELDKERKARTKAEEELKAERDARAALETKSRLKDRDDEIVKALKDAREPRHVLIIMKEEMPELIEAAIGEDGKINKEAVAKVAIEAKKAYKNQFGSSGGGSLSNSDGHNSSDRGTKEAHAALDKQAKRGI